MTTNSLSKKYYNIGEVAQLLSLPQSTLRFWEKEFPQIKPKRTPHGRRAYTAADIESVRMISYLLRDRGMHIDAARQELKRNRDGIARHSEAIEELKSIKSKLIELLDSLHHLR